MSDKGVLAPTKGMSLQFLLAICIAHPFVEEHFDEAFLPALIVQFAVLHDGLIRKRMVRLALEVGHLFWLRFV
jgi:hypothetical protein